ncbi:MAG TPA: hypothetical protein DCW74_16895 [Alteromonas australica]|uniref:Uncharacterized protein n=1 Tax=Alteromonas australica TaxID=589873 RepID=A0A350P7Y0_9ALTE|nr:hypothetical protein [Alteromonas australica]
MGNFQDQVNEDYDRLHRWPLDSSLKAGLLSPEDVEARLNGGENAIELSIQKWEKLRRVIQEIGEDVEPSRFYKALRDFTGMDSCALCLKAIQKLKEDGVSLKSREDKCRVCPLATVDQCTKSESVFSRIDDLLYFGESDPFYSGDSASLQRDLESLVLQMLENLRKL